MLFLSACSGNEKSNAATIESRVVVLEKQQSTLPIETEETVETRFTLRI
jgi:hypothetical protein